MTARYLEIAGELRERIKSGELQPGHLLPKISETAAQHGVSVATARQVYALLTQEGLIGAKGRWGTRVLTHPDRTRLFVRTRRVERDDLGYFSGPESQHWRAVPHATGEKTLVVQAPVPEDVAGLLGGVQAGQALTMRKRIVGDPSTPGHRQIADSWIAPWVLEELPVLSGDTGLGGMYDRLEEWSGGPLVWREEVSARNPSPEEAEVLEMPAVGVPILRALRVTSLAEPAENGESVVEVQDIRMSAGVFALGYPTPRAPSARWPVSPATGDYYQAPAPDLELENG